MNNSTYRNLKFVFLFGFLFSLVGCVNLKTVADFSSVSTKSIQNFEKIDYSFLTHCLDRCELEAIRTYDIKPFQECSCALYKEADSVTQVIYNTIKGYFDGLVNLSNNELTNYHSDAFINALSADELGPVKIDAQMVSAFSSLSNTLLRASTDLSRKKKIVSYLEQANEPIQLLLENFSMIIDSNLKGELKFKQARLYSYYMDMKMTGSEISAYEKSKATADYYQALKTINRKEMELTVYAKSIREIAKGHQVIYDNRNKLSFKDLSGLLLSYSSNVQDLIAEFNKITD